MRELAKLDKIRAPLASVHRSLESPDDFREAVRKSNPLAASGSEPIFRPDRVDGAGAELAGKGLCTTTPNPRVGRALTQGDAVVGEGWHEKTVGRTPKSSP